MAKEKENISIKEVGNVLSKAELYIEENQKSLTIIFIVILVIIASYFAFKNFYLLPADKEAQEEMYMAEKYFELDSFRLALEGYEGNLGFLDIIKEYRLTKTANLACYYAGICYLNLGEYNEAIKYLKKFDSNDKIISTIAIGSMGDAYLELGNKKKAAELFIKASEKNKNNITSPLYLRKAALVYEDLNKKKEALKVYQDIKNKYPRSPFANDIDKDIERLSYQIEKK